MTHFSELMKELLGINYNCKAKRIRSINLSENVIMCAISGSWKDFIQTQDGHLILVPVSPTCAFIDGLLAQSDPIPSDLVLYFNIYGLDENGNYEKIYTLLNLRNFNAPVRRFMRFSTAGKTLWEIVKVESNQNFLKHKDDTEWFFGFECVTPQTGENISEIFIAQLRYKKGISITPLEGISV